MPLYFMLFDAAVYDGHVKPALAESWRQRSFEPCRPLADYWVRTRQGFLQQNALDMEEPLLAKVARGLPFHRHYWTQLVGETLLYAAAELPELAVAPETLCCILAPESYVAGDLPRERYPPILQAHFGARNLWFGKRCYRPDLAGLNVRRDVARLAEYLTPIDPRTWSGADLALHRDCHDAAERDEELADARDWFPALRDLYRRANERGQVVVCEVLDSGREL